jgi:preprotein translocase subunit YajC
VHFHPAVQAVLAASSGKSSGSPIGTFVLFGLILVGGYMLFIRPQRARQRKALDTKRAIDVGAEVVTTAGLIARVVELDDETAVLEVAPGVHSRFLRQAIVRVVEPDLPDPPPADDTTLPDATRPDATRPEAAPMPEPTPADDAPPDNTPTGV